MVLAYHLVWVAYGWWLPNDPRGSMSDSIKRDILSELGNLHNGRKRIQPAGRAIREFYERAKDLLLHDLLTFSDTEMGMIAHAFAETIKAQRYSCYACAIMPDHIHMVIRKHRHRAEDMIIHFQRASKDAVMLMNKRHPLHPVWGGPGWKVFLNTPQDIERTIKYVQDNPTKAKLPAQSYEFVTKYDGWPFHKGGR
jgi:REP element-mobilizing transposase RayT